MKHSMKFHVALLGLLTVACLVLSVIGISTDSTRPMDQRIQVAAILQTESRVRDLIWEGQRSSIAPLSAIQQQLGQLKAQVVHLCQDRDPLPMSDDIEEKHLQFHNAAENLLTIDSGFRNSLNFIEQSSRSFSDSPPADDSRWHALRSKVAAMWASRESGFALSQQLLPAISELETGSWDASTAGSLNLLKRHVENAIEQSETLDSQLAYFQWTPLADVLRQVDRQLVETINAKSRSNSLVTRVFSVVAFTLVGLVFSLLWELNRKSQQLSHVNISLEEKVQREAERIRKVEEELFQSRKLESIGVLAAGIAHEINTPMQCVTSNVEFLKRYHGKVTQVMERVKQLLQDPSRVTAQQLEELEQAMAHCRLERLCGQANDAIDESADATMRVIEIVRAMKSMSHPGTSEKVLTDLNQLIRSASTIARSHWKEAATLELQLSDGLAPVECLPGELSQVFLNLVVNAADACHERYPDRPDLGQIVISSYPDEEGTIVQIRDNGMGIPAEIQRRVFDPFFTTKDVGKGTGQGLALTHNVIINKHGGRITLDSEPGQGTTLLIWLPNSSSMELC